MNKKNITLLILGIMALVAVASYIALVCLGKPHTPFKTTLHLFSKEQHDRVDKLSKQLDLPLSASVSNFFIAAESSSWQTISNRFNAFLLTDNRKDGIIPMVQNELWAPIIETLGAHEVLNDWREDDTLLKMFYEPILASMPQGSIYMGGTDAGRFVITAAANVLRHTDVYCITQNQFADPNYLAFLRNRYNKDLKVLQIQDHGNAFQQYVQDVLAGRKDKRSIKIENGRAQVCSVEGVMEINGILSKKFFELNKNGHEFFIEESHPVNWMYPYLEPHGLILKLNRTPMETLGADVILADQSYWRDYVSRLLKQPNFQDNYKAKMAFAKLRCAIAGLYVYRKCYEDAEIAFKQAQSLCPVYYEAVFRLSRMYEEQGRINDALAMIQTYINLDERTLALFGEIKPPYSQAAARQYASTLQQKITR